MFLIRKIVLFLKEKSFRNLTLSTLIIILNGTLIYHFAEGWKWLDCLYFSIISLTTVGYGDLAPKTNFGKIFTMVYVLAGIGIMFGFINAFYQHQVSNREKLRRRKKIEH